jgi:hypothetical protein
MSDPTASLDELAARHLDGEIAAEEWKRLLAQHGRPLSAAVARERSMRTALHALPRPSTPAAVTAAILAHAARATPAVTASAPAPAATAAAATLAAPAATRAKPPLRLWFGIGSVLAAAALVIAMMQLERGPAKQRSSPVASASDVAAADAPPAAAAEPIVARADKSRRLDAIGPADLPSLEAERLRAREEDGTIGGARSAQGATAYRKSGPSFDAKDATALDGAAAKANAAAAAPGAGAKHRGEELAKDDDELGALAQKPATGGYLLEKQTTAPAALNDADRVDQTADNERLSIDKTPEVAADATARDAAKVSELRKEVEAKKSTERSAKAKSGAGAPPAVLPAAPPAAAAPAASEPAKPAAPVANPRLRLDVPSGQTPLVADLSIENASRDALPVPRGALILEGIDSAGTTVWRHATGLPAEATTLAPGAKQTLTLTLTGVHALPPSIVHLRLRLRQTLSDACPLPRRE